MMKKTDHPACENAVGKPTYEELLARTIKAEEHCLYYQTLLDETQRIARLGSWEWDINSKHLSWSKETYHIFGLEPGPENQNNYEAFNRALNLQDRKLVNNAIKQTLRHNKIYAIDFRITEPIMAKREFSTLRPMSCAIRLTAAP